MRTNNKFRNKTLQPAVSVRRSKPQWRETENFGEDNINDDLVDDRFSHGYHNPDYEQKNFWPAEKNSDIYRYDEDEPTGYIESQNRTRRPAGAKNEAVGYGNENSQSVEDFYNMKYVSKYTDPEEKFRNRKKQPKTAITKSGASENLDIFEDVPVKNIAENKEFRRLKRPNIRDKR